MKHDPIPHRGGAPVGQISDLPMLETSFVLYLRLWCTAGKFREKVHTDFLNFLGKERGRLATENFAELCAMCVHNGRRPLMHHQITCKCLGADESCFANFVATATEGDREDAMLIATLLVRPDLAPRVATLAHGVGLALKEMLLKSRAAPSQITHTSQTLH